MRVLGLTDSSTGYTVFTFLNFCLFVFTCNKMGQDCTHTLHICEQQCIVAHQGWLGGPPGIVESL